MNVNRTIGLVFLLAAGPSAAMGAATTIYDGALGTSPAAQGLAYTAADVTPLLDSIEAVLTVLPDRARVDSQADMDDLAGFSTTAVPLDRSTGFVVRFRLALLAEAHVPAPGGDDNGDGLIDRAGLSLTVVTSDLAAIELALASDRIFAQADSPLFTQAESVARDPSETGLVDYELTVLGGGYSLAAGGSTVLSGALRDYAAFSGWIDPYETPNMLAISDNTTRGSSVFELSFLEVEAIPEPGSVALLAVGGLVLLIRRRGWDDCGE